MLVAGLRNRVQQALESKKPTLFFVDRQGNIEDVSLEAKAHDEKWATEEWVILLNEEAKMASGGSYFEICSIGPNANDMTQLFLNVPDLANLSEALEHARAERTRFYVERVEAHGMSALPRDADEELVAAAKTATTAKA